MSFIDAGTFQMYKTIVYDDDSIYPVHNTYSNSERGTYGENEADAGRPAPCSSPVSVLTCIE